MPLPLRSLFLPLLLSLIVSGGFFKRAQASPGELDPTFGTHGKVVTRIPGDASDTALAVAIQPRDGKIVTLVISQPTLTTFRSILVRYNQDGTLDTSFGRAGNVIDNLGNYWQTLAIQGDGKILVGGASSSNGRWQFAVGRYNSDGSPDVTFGGNGHVTTPFQNGSNDNVDVDALALQPDGKIIAAGGPPPYSLNSQGLFYLARYNSDGSLDTLSNGTIWKITYRNDIVFDGGVAKADTLAAVVLQPDGKIVIAGTMSDRTENNVLRISNTPVYFRIARFNPDGTVDNSFNATAEVGITDANDVIGAHAMVLQNDGKFVVSGGSTDVSSTTPKMTSLRYNQNGSLDSSFGAGGKITTMFEGEGGSIAVSSILQADGKIVDVGDAIDARMTHQVFAITRHNSDGSLDSSFGIGGKTTTAFDGTISQVKAATIQMDGKIVAAGMTYADDGLSASIVLARYLGGECLPTTCPAEGKNCGTIDDGCGSNLSCGDCTSPNICGGSGTANVCGNPSVSHWLDRFRNYFRPQINHFIPPPPPPLKEGLKKK